MRKVLIISALLAGAGLFSAALASERSRPVQEGSQPTAQSERVGKGGERTGAARDDRSHESCERYREAQREGREYEDDEDRE